MLSEADKREIRKSAERQAALDEEAIDAEQNRRNALVNAEKLTALRSLLREIDPAHVLFEVRDMFQQRVKAPRERAILVRYMEDAAAWALAMDSGRIPPLPAPPLTPNPR